MAYVFLTTIYISMQTMVLMAMNFGELMEAPMVKHYSKTFTQVVFLHLPVLMPVYLFSKTTYISVHKAHMMKGLNCTNLMVPQMAQPYF